MVNEYTKRAIKKYNAKNIKVLAIDLIKSNEYLLDEFKKVHAPSNPKKLRLLLDLYEHKTKQK